MPPAHKLFTSNVSLITSVDKSGRGNIMLCSWMMNVRFDPLQVMVVINKNTLTHQNIVATGIFGVNLSSEKQADLMHVVADISGHYVNKLEDRRLRDWLYKAELIPVAMVIDSVMSIECELINSLDMDDHTGFIGQAVALKSNPHLKPLIYQQGRYFHVGDEIPRSIADPVRV